MLDLRYVSENFDEVRASLARRGAVDSETLGRVASLSERRRTAIAKVETLRAERNSASEQMAKLDKKSEAFATQREALRTVGDRIKENEVELAAVESELEELLLHIPNLPHESTPDGKSEHDNVELRVWGERPSFDFPVKDHVDLGAALGILDFERAAKITGARFVILKGLGARLERALMQFMLDTHTTEHGYTEVWPPVLVNDASMRGTGQLPKFANDAFRIAKDWDTHGETEGHELYLSPTAEVQVTNYHRDEILEASALPATYTAYSACFRSEAGSYGKDTRGMIRQHQFDKVELVRFATPESAEAELEKLTSHAEAILQKLGLHYRVIQLCAGDLGFTSKKTYDLEVWLPSQNTFREISSCSWFGDFQARRIQCRYRPEPKAKPRFVHTLNGSGLAIGRTLVAILEQGQAADGSVRIPRALVPYMGGVESIRIA